MVKQDKNPTEKSSILRQLPSVGKLLSTEIGKDFIHRYGKGLTTFALRTALQTARENLMRQEHLVSDTTILQTAEREILFLASATYRSVVNATGIILHTGLGRAPLSIAAAEAISQTQYYSTVEVDLQTGERSKREQKTEQLLQELTGCEAATVVNNCAAAIFLALAALASPGEVIISRGQLVEIGGSYRMPDVMQASGCVLREVGTTNRTSLNDYRRAANDKTTAILVVSQSNFRIRGFTSTPELDEICRLGKELGIPVLYDLGGGALVNLEEWGLSHETTVQEALRAGVEMLCFSGDKLLGGPQAGIICGTKESITKIRKSHYFRMFRPDKLCLAGLEATLVSFVNNTFRDDIPLYQMASVSKAELQRRAEIIRDSLPRKRHYEATMIDDLAYIGGGSLPDEALPSVALRITSTKGSDKHKDRWAIETAQALRLQYPAIFSRLESSSVVLNLRTVFPNQLESLQQTLQHISVVS